MEDRDPGPRVRLGYARPPSRVHRFSVASIATAIALSVGWGLLEGRHGWRLPRLTSAVWAGGYACGAVCGAIGARVGWAGVVGLFLCVLGTFASGVVAWFGWVWG